MHDAGYTARTEQVDNHVNNYLVVNQQELGLSIDEGESENNM